MKNNPGSEDSQVYDQYTLLRFPISLGDMVGFVCVSAFDHFHPNSLNAIATTYIVAPDVGSSGSPRFSEGSSQKLLRLGKRSLRTQSRAITTSIKKLTLWSNSISGCRLFRSPAFQQGLLVRSFASTLSYYLNTVLPSVKLL